MSLRVSDIIVIISNEYLISLHLIYIILRYLSISRRERTFKCFFHYISLSTWFKLFNILQILIIHGIMINFIKLWKCLLRFHLV